MVNLGELVIILDLARQGLSVSAIARRTGHDPETIKKYLERGMQAPAYMPRPPAPSPLAGCGNSIFGPGRRNIDSRRRRGA